MSSNKARKLTEKQYEILKSIPKSDMYTVYGNLSKKWYVYFSKCDKYSLGYSTKEEAEDAIENSIYLNPDYTWYPGNSIVL